jgi:hypothetical protein
MRGEHHADENQEIFFRWREDGVPFIVDRQAILVVVRAARSFCMSHEPIEHVRYRGSLFEIGVCQRFEYSEKKPLLRRVKFSKTGNKLDQNAATGRVIIFIHRTLLLAGFTDWTDG